MLLFAWFLASSCCIFIILTIIVIKNRYRTMQTLNNADNDEGLNRAVRAHGNFTEMTPFGLMAIWLMIYANLSPIVIMLVGSSFFIGRILHAFSLLYLEPKLNIIKCRMIGMVLSFATLICGIISFFVSVAP